MIIPANINFLCIFITPKVSITKPIMNNASSVYIKLFNSVEKLMFTSDIL